MAQSAKTASAGAPGGDCIVSIATNRSAWGNGRGRKRIPSTSVKMAVVAPIPNASVITVETVKTGLRLNCRRANFASPTNVENIARLWQHSIRRDRTL